MKSLFLIAATAALALSGCNPAPAKKTNKFHVGKHQVYHFDDGRVGYRDDTTMLWYFLANPTTSSSGTPTIAGGWTVGTAPSKTDIDEAEVETQGVVEDSQSEPVDAAEAEAVETANPDVAETAPDAAAATGEISASVDFGVSAEGSVGETSTDTGSDTGSSDTGPSDAGGGGDSGGGGGGGE
jgi:hypothetical protein